VQSGAIRNNELLLVIGGKYIIKIIQVRLAYACEACLSPPNEALSVATLGRIASASGSVKASGVPGVKRGQSRFRQRRAAALQRGKRRL
jgi:hypothetical protein